MKISLWITLLCITGCLNAASSSSANRKPPLSFSTCLPDELEAIRAYLIVNRIEDPTSPQFFCLICGHETTRRCSLTNHMNKNHPIIKYLDPDGNVRFTCYYCKKIWSEERDIIKHQCKKHRNRQPKKKARPA